MRGWVALAGSGKEGVTAAQQRKRCACAATWLILLDDMSNRLLLWMLVWAGALRRRHVLVRVGTQMPSTCLQYLPSLAFGLSL